MADRWNAVSRLVLACVLERPERLRLVDESDLAPGPARRLAALMRERAASGLAVDAAAMRGLDVTEAIGPTFVLDIIAEDFLQASFDGYVIEARRLAAAAELRGVLDEGITDHGRAARALARMNGGARRRLTRLDVVEMVETLPPEVPWVAEPLLVRGALTLLFGREGEGKSLVALAVAIAVAAGEEVAGFRPSPGPVVYVDGENGPGEIHRRVRALGLAPAAAPRLSVFGTDSLDLGRDLAELDELLAEERPAVLVLDSFRSLWAGSENDSDEVAPVLDRLRNMGRRHGTATLLLHHTGKMGSEYRGSTAIGAAAELAFLLGREPEDDDSSRRFLACRKSRPAPEPGRRWLRLGTELGMTFIEEVGAPEGAEEAKRAPGRPATARQELGPLVRSVLAEARPLTRTEIARAVGRDPKDRSVGRVLEALEQEGAARRLLDGRWEGGETPGPLKGAEGFATPSDRPSEAGSGGGNTGVAGEGFATPSDEDLERWFRMGQEGDQEASDDA